MFWPFFELSLKKEDERKNFSLTQLSASPQLKIGGLTDLTVKVRSQTRFGAARDNLQRDLPVAQRKLGVDDRRRSADQQQPDGGDRRRVLDVAAELQPRALHGDERQAI